LPSKRRHSSHTSIGEHLQLNVVHQLHKYTWLILVVG
jgi:hypothetical protein